jgi:hypothetical protein
LGAWVRDDDELLQMMSEHVGSGASPVLRFLLKATGWMSPNKLAAAVRPRRWQSLASEV